MAWQLCRGTGAHSLHLGLLAIMLGCWPCWVEAQTSVARLTFGGRFTDTLGRNLYTATGSGQGVRLTFRNTRTSEELVTTSLNGSGDASVTFAQGAQVGDPIACSIAVSGSSTATLLSPSEVVLTASDLPGPATRSFVVGGPAGTRSLTLNVRLVDAAGRGLGQLTGGGYDVSPAFTNLRSGRAWTTTFTPWNGWALPDSGSLSVGMPGTGNQVAVVGDLLGVSVKLSGSLTSTEAEPSTIVVTAGDIVRQRTPVHLVTVRARPATRSLRFHARFVDTLGRGLGLATSSGYDTRLAFTNVRTGAVYARAYTPWNGYALASDGSTWGQFDSGGNQAAVVGDVVAVSARLSGSLTSTASYPSSFVVTAGDIALGQTPVHLVTIGAAPSTRSLVFRTRFVDALGRGLGLVTSSGSDTRVAFSNLRSGVVYERAFTPWNGYTLASDGSSTGIFDSGGNQAAMVGDVIAVSARLSGSLTSTLSYPTSFVVTAGDVASQQTPVHTVTIGSAPSTRGFALNVRLLDSGGGGLGDVTEGGNSVHVTCTNLRSGRVFDTTFTPWNGYVLDSAGNTSAGFGGTSDLNQAALAGDVLRLDVSYSHCHSNPGNPCGPVYHGDHPAPSEFVVTAADIVAGGTPRYVVKVMQSPDVTPAGTTSHLRVQGTVVDGFGRPLDGATVSVRAEGIGVVGSARTPTSTLRRGSFSVDLWSPPSSSAWAPPATVTSLSDRLVIDVTDPILGSLRQSLVVTQGNLDAGVASRDLAFARVRHLRFEFEGDVADRLGRPIDGARVTMTHLGTGLSASTTTPAPSESGHFLLRVQGPAGETIQVNDRVRLEVSAPSFVSSVNELIVPAASINADGTGSLRGLRLVLEDQARTNFLQVRGIVRDSGGRPLDGVVVRVVNPRTGHSASSRAPVSSPAGSYELALDGSDWDSVRVDDALRVEDVGFLGVTRPSTPRSLVLTGGDISSRLRVQDLVVDAPPRTRLFLLRGRVVGTGDAPVDQARVSLTNTRTATNVTMWTPSGSAGGSFEMPFQDANVGAAAVGDAWVASVAAQGWTTTVFNLMFSEAEVRAGTAFRELHLERPAVGVPVLAGVTPATGPRTLPTPVTLSGSGFAAAIGARLEGTGGTALTSVRALSDSVITAVIPAGLPAGTYVLTVFNEAGPSIATNVTFAVTDPFAGVPVARAVLHGRSGGPSQVVQLDGTGSTGESLAYLWTLSSGPSRAVTFTDGSSVVAYNASAPGHYVFGLTVSDARGRKATDSVSLDIVGAPPVARIFTEPALTLRDPNHVIPTSETTDVIRLDGTGSFDPSALQPVTFLWSLLEAPPESSLRSAFAASNLTAPSLQLPLAATQTGGRMPEAGRYVFGLTVTGSGGTASTSAEVVALDPNNLAPRADAGLEQSVRVTVLNATGPVLDATIPDPTVTPPGNLRAFLRLDGHESSDPTGHVLTYQWRSISRPAGSAAVTLSSTATVAPTFAVAVAGDYTFGLTVGNGRYTSLEDSVSVHVAVAAVNALPNAEAVARNVATGQTSNAGQPLQVRAGDDLVELDGTLSSDQDDPPPLTYQWVQTEGQAVVLSPGASDARPRFVPPAPDMYGFELTVKDARQARSTPFKVRVHVVWPQGTPPALRLVSSASTTALTGEDFSLDDELARPRSLRVHLPSTVTLSAFLTAPDEGLPPLYRQVVTSWKQVAGPLVRLRPAVGVAGVRSAVSFNPTTSRVHVFRAQAVELDSVGNPTGVEIERFARVVVDGQVRVPEAIFQVLVAGRSKGTFSATAAPKATPLVRPQTVVTLNGRSSVDYNTPPRPLFYSWVQTAGPRVVLSNATGSITTFAVPRLKDRNAHDYTFQLFVDNGNDRSEPVPGTLKAVPETGVPMEQGLNVVSVPLNPSTTGDVYDAGDLLRDTGALYVARATTSGRFELYHPGLGMEPFAIDGNCGYVLPRLGAATPFLPLGVDWTTRSVSLVRGMNLVGYPAPVPATMDAAALRAAAEADFVVVFTSGGKATPYMEGLTPSFPIQAGQGILLIVPKDKVLQMPAGQ